MQENKNTGQIRCRSAGKGLQTLPGLTVQSPPHSRSSQSVSNLSLAYPTCLGNRYLRVQPTPPSYCSEDVNKSPPQSQNTPAHLVAQFHPPRGCCISSRDSTLPSIMSEVADLFKWGWGGSREGLSAGDSSSSECLPHESGSPWVFSR